VALLVLALLTRKALPGEAELSPRDLYRGFEARKVLLEDAGRRLALDARVFDLGTERQGIVVTDPIDLGSRTGIVGLAGRVTGAEVEVSALVPPGTSVEVEARSGANPLADSGWSPWRRLASFREMVRPLAGRYLQLRITLHGTASNQSPARPALTGIKLRPTEVAAEPWRGKLAVLRDDLQKIVRSPIPFQYERPDQPKLQRFRQLAKLDEVVAGGRSDFEQLVRLMDWVGSGLNLRDEAWGEPRGGGRPYPWDIEQVATITPQGKLVVKGHCMSYAEVLIAAATALGYHARHWAIDGFRDMGHEVTEIWVPSLRKWVYFDPSLTSYYYDTQSREPLNVLELHWIVAERFLRPGEDMNWWVQGEGKDEAVKARVREVGGKTHVGCRVGPFCYGKPMPRDYDWGWNHGYLAAGFVQLTPRNDFHSHPEFASRHLGGAERMVADGYPHWVDEKTPPRREGNGQVSNWFTRPRDFYWTLDQAAIELVQGKEGTLLVHLGHSMPFFRQYRVRVDGVEQKEVAQPFAWQLKAGVNRLEVAAVDHRGKAGLASVVEIDYTDPSRSSPGK
jgi:hypothetical protein